jgi:iron(III) transport system ATP-binding protein
MISLQSLRKTYDTGGDGHGPAVDGIDLEVAPGEFFTLLGPSGCGKTTTLRMLAGLIAPDDGRIVVNGTCFFDKSQAVDVPSHRRGLGMVFQSYAIWPHMTVSKNVAFPLTGWFKRKGRLSKAQIGERVERALHMVQLESFAKRPATDLSGGQQQRLALARALVTEPQVLLLDEPLSNLDAKLRESMRFELKKLQRNLGLTTVYVTHDQTEALAMSNSIAVMNEGKVEQVGHPRDIYERPASHFVASFIGSSNFLEGTVKAGGPEGRWEILTSIGPVVAQSRVPLTVGDTATISIRPEHVRMQPISPGDSGGFHGKIEARAFEGDSVQHQVIVDGVQLSVQCNPSVTFAKDDEVVIEFPAEWCSVIPGLTQ